MFGQNDEAFPLPCIFARKRFLFLVFGISAATMSNYIIAIMHGVPQEPKTIEITYY